MSESSTTPDSASRAPESLHDKMMSSVSSMPIEGTDDVIGDPKPVAKTDAVADEAKPKADDAPPIPVETDDEGGEASDEPDEGGDDDETESEGTVTAKDEPKDLDPAFVAAMHHHGIKADFSDVPKEIQGVLVEKLKHMESGYTRTMQQAATFRKDKAVFEADKQYQEQHPEQYVADLLSKHPTLIDEINAELDRRQDPTYSKALDKEREASRKMAQMDAQEREAKEAAHEAEIEALESYVDSALAKAKVPVDLVGEAITLLTSRTMQTEQRLPTRQEIDAVIQAKSKVFGRHMNAQKGATKRKMTEQYVADKQQDKATAGVTGKPSGTVSATVTPTPDGRPRTLREKMLATAEAMGM